MNLNIPQPLPKQKTKKLKKVLWQADELQWPVQYSFRSRPIGLNRSVDLEAHTRPQDGV